MKNKIKPGKLTTLGRKAASMLRETFYGSNSNRLVLDETTGSVPKTLEKNEGIESVYSPATDVLSNNTHGEKRDNSVSAKSTNRKTEFVVNSLDDGKNAKNKDSNDSRTTFIENRDRKENSKVKMDDIDVRNVAEPNRDTKIHPVEKDSSISLSKSVDVCLESEVDQDIKTVYTILEELRSESVDDIVKAKHMVVLNRLLSSCKDYVLRWSMRQDLISAGLLQAFENLVKSGNSDIATQINIFSTNASLDNLQSCSDSDHRVPLEVFHLAYLKLKRTDCAKLLLDFLEQISEMEPNVRRMRQAIKCLSRWHVKHVGIQTDERPYSSGIKNEQPCMDTNYISKNICQPEFGSIKDTQSTGSHETPFQDKSNEAKCNIPNPHVDFDFDLKRNAPLPPIVRRPRSNSRAPSRSFRLALAKSTHYENIPKKSVSNGSGKSMIDDEKQISDGENKKNCDLVVNREEQLISTNEPKVDPTSLLATPKTVSTPLDPNISSTSKLLKEQLPVRQPQPPPPPPPLPPSLPFNCKQISFATSIKSPSIVKPSVVYKKTRKTITVHWNPVKPDAIIENNTVWGCRFPDDMCLTEMLRERLENVFSRNPVASDRKTAAQRYNNRSNPVKQGLQSHCGLTDKRALNLSIALKRYRPLSPVEIVNVIMNDSSDDCEIFSNTGDNSKRELISLLHCFPTANELRYFEKLNSSDGLRDAELFCYLAARCKNIHLRLELIAVSDSCTNQIKQLRNSATVLINASHEALNNSNLHLLFHRCLLFGNFLNQSSFSAHAGGFLLSSLLEILSCKAQNESGLHLVDIIAESANPSFRTLIDAHQVISVINSSVDELESAEIDLRKSVKDVSTKLAVSDEKELQTRYTLFLKNSLESCCEVKLLIETLRKTEKQLREFYCAQELSIVEILEILGKAIGLVKAALPAADKRMEKLKNTENRFSAGRDFYSFSKSGENTLIIKKIIKQRSILLMNPDDMLCY